MRKAETSIKTDCVAAALRLGHWCEANHGNAYTRKGRSDVQGATKDDSIAFYVELKVPGELPTPDQAGYLLQISQRCKNALIGYATSVDEFLRVIDRDRGVGLRLQQLAKLIEISRKGTKSKPARGHEYRRPNIALDSLDRTL